MESAKSRLVKLLACSCMSIAGVAANAAASPTWTVTGIGVIRDGLDTSGLFGAPGASLRGDAFSLSITASVDPSLWSDSTDNGWYSRVLYGTGPGFDVRATVNGHTAFFHEDHTDDGAQRLFDGAQWPFGDKDTISSDEAAGPLQVYVRAVSWSYNGMGRDFSQVATITPPVYGFSDAWFAMNDGTSVAWFEAEQPLVMMNVVPEPSSGALLGLGVAGLAALGWRRRASRAPASPGGPAGSMA